MEKEKIKMLYNILQRARKMGASDIHISVNSYPMVRVDGELLLLNGNKLTGTVEGSEDNMLVAEATLYYGFKLDKLALQGIVEQLIGKKLLWTLEKCGEVDIAWEDNRLGRYRANIFKENGSYAISMRLINKKIPSCKQLGIPDTVQNLMNVKNGLIIVTGPTGCGKSTTLAALIEKINHEKSAHIITLEDPIEYKYSLGNGVINQREIGTDTQTFASGLRNALREDPDIILVGELRDAEAVKVALQAAETGHLVLSTLHTKDAVATINRLIDMLPEAKEQTRSQLADCLVGIIAQELVKRSDGKGRIAAMEILLNNNAVANLIREGRTHQIYSYMQTGNKLGMQTMQASMDALKKQKLI